MLKTTTNRCIRRHSVLRPRARLRRNLLTLAIESSCDDSCIAILEKHDQPKAGKPMLEIHHHEKYTSNNLAYHGVHPLEALHSHQENLARLAAAAVHRLPKAEGPASSPLDQDLVFSHDGHEVVAYRKPDCITVTRGPGMRANLSAGLDMAKGLAVAWQRPLVGVNHMQAHALTPRLVTAMHQTDEGGAYKPAFPFLSLLVSGGHTMLIHSEELNNHAQLASTADVAIGDAIDKIARYVLPPDVIEQSRSTMYGPTLERFAFPRGAEDHCYTPPTTRSAEINRYNSPSGWSLGLPMALTKGGTRTHDLEFSFSGLCSSVKRNMGEFTADGASPTLEQRRELATQAMRLAFEHLANRVRLALQQSSNINTIVVSGGVASNGYLRRVLRAYLDHSGFTHIELNFPPVHLCTDNAIMIGWTGIEMFEQGWHSDFSIRSTKKWSLDPKADDGGILGVSGWLNHKRPP